MSNFLTIWRRIPAFLLEGLIRGYQVMLSPLLIGTCKFYPTCSEYSAQAVREWGVVRGGWLTIKRLLRCRPMTMGGIDPVPLRHPPSDSSPDAQQTTSRST